MASNIQAITQGPAIGTWQDAFTYNFLEGSSQSYKLGAPLKFSSGTVVVSTVVTAPTLVGFALAAATGTTSANAPVLLSMSPVQLQISVDTTTTNGQAALGTGKPSDFTVGANYEMLLDSTSGNYYMGTGTATPTFQLLGYDPSQASVVNGRVYVRVIQTQTVWT